MSLSELLASVSAERDDKSASLPLPEAQIMELQALLQRYVAPCPYSPGDLVTPRANTSVRGAGLPHIVLELGHPSEPVKPESASSSAYGRRIDMRVAVYCDQHAAITRHWVESIDFEPYSQN